MFSLKIFLPIKICGKGPQKFD